MEPLSPLAIVTLAFIGHEAAIATVRKSTEAALEKVVNLLRQKIIDKLSGNPKAEKALLAAQDGSQPHVQVLSNSLQKAMAEDDKFAQEIKALAKEIHNLNQVEGENWQVSGGEVNYNKVSGGEVNYNKDNKAPVFQGGSINTVNFNNYNNPPEH
ncbi:MAG: hypothetical protein F6J90_31355 [Moorea sp. SIOASIH]|uniref:hypothetical protein n=1 Tax=Moorena sp. SIOASIH TaxID=2607817 RepID=UPI0013B5F249|nr:hypothetical protein [Moorena sp. SIOASIH]NEO40589.1 hypothetical protein [Moorena sp. SIOASIH]